MRTRLFVGEAFRSVTANLSTTIAATMTVLIGMFLLGLFIALGTWVLSWTDEVKKDVIVRVFFDQNATNRQIEAVRADLVGRPDVAKVVFVSKEDALRRMREKHPELVKNLASNPLPASYEVTPKRAEQVEAVAGSLDPLPRGVEKVNYGKKTTDRILQVAKIIGGIFLVGSLILLTASTLLIANTIRLSIFSRRREVEVMKLVGATNWFVRGPFMLEGIICGLVGSAVAVTLLLMAKEFALPSILGRIDEPGDGVNAISFPLMALILVSTSLLVGALGSGITLRRFLKV
ncbi:MAG: permease-like cell division protein FtsX [Actinomycetota bacterium]|nr:permease-like cell division protein FtsX [Actinomycetota bacterium]